MGPRALEARIIGYTATHGVYQTLTVSGRRKVAKDPRPIEQTKDDSDDENIEWPTKPIQDLTDIAEGRPGRNYNWHCPEKEECPEGTHAEDEPKTPEKVYNE